MLVLISEGIAVLQLCAMSSTSSEPVGLLLEVGILSDESRSIIDRKSLFDAHVGAQRAMGAVRPNINQFCSSS